ncbi:MAG: HlyC/CorC family transporter [Lachnospiraceae bacterium]|nr:HlyC/CorC family transporter [Lachnospiraceae bacterium]
MNDGSPLWGLIVFCVLLILHGILYGYGAALQNLTDSSVEKKAEEGDKRARKLLQVIEEPARFVNTLLTVITLANMIVGAYEYAMLRTWMVRTFVLQDGAVWQIYGLKLAAWVIPALVLLLVLLVFGILVPKKLAQRYPEGWAYRLQGVVSVLTAAFLPLTGLITLFSNAVIRLFGINPEEELDNVTEEEIMSMVNEGHEQGVLLASEAEMITNIFEFGDKQAADIMTHRKNIVAVDGAWTLKETVNFILTQSNSRFPVYDKDIDNIIGILHFKDAMIYYEENDTDRPLSEIAELLREPHFIPETRNINLLFKEMQSQKIHMEIVVDEYGQTAGLVAMEDILEEIVGNILDEYDEDEEMIMKQEDGSYLIRGMAELDEVWKVLSLEMEEAEEEYDTLNGFLIYKLDRIPQDGEKLEITYKGYLFSALEVENKTVQLVRVTKLEPEEETEEAQ